MTNRPARRRARPNTKRTEAGMSAALKALFDVGPYHRNEINQSQINRLRDMIDRNGRQDTADKVGVSVVTLLAVTSGFGHKLQVRTAAKIRKFFGE